VKTALNGRPSTRAAEDIFFLRFIEGDSRAFSLGGGIWVRVRCEKRTKYAVMFW
jgi:hypothetical protein